MRRHLSACFEARIADFAFLPNSATPACVSLPPIFRPQFGESRFNNLPREADVTLTCPSISQRLLSRSNLAFRIAKPVLRFSHLPPAYTHLSLSQRTLRSCRSTRQSINHPHHRLSLYRLLLLRKPSRPLVTSLYLLVALPRGLLEIISAPPTLLPVHTTIFSLVQLQIEISSSSLPAP